MKHAYKYPTVVMQRLANDHTNTRLGLSSKHQGIRGDQTSIGLPAST